MFFFQAEDGIRDLVRSRGLGDVYKRQITDSVSEALALISPDQRVLAVNRRFVDLFGVPQAVSYTHLTLPTSDLV